MCVQVTLLTPILAAKQRELTYYRQHDGIVKSVGGLIRRARSGLRDPRQRPLNEAGGTFPPHTDPGKMVTSSHYLEAPRRLRAFVRAHETSLVVLAALVGTISGLVVAAMSAAVEGLHVLLFNLEMGDRLSSQFRIEPLRALLVPSLGGLLLGVAFLLLLRWRPAREIDPIEANALHGGRMSFRGSLIVALQTVWSSGVGASVGLEAGYTQLASGLAASLGRGFHLRRGDQRIMVGCGAAAAIAGAFGAPLAGAFYAFELVIGGYTPASLTPVGVAAVAGYFVAHGIHSDVAGRRRRCGRRCARARSRHRGVARRPGGAVRHRHHARRGAVRDVACQDQALAAAAAGAGGPRRRPARPDNAAGDVVGARRAAFCRICFNSAFGARDHFHPESDCFRHLAGIGFRGGLFFATLFLGAIGGHLFAGGFDAIWPGLNLSPNVYAIIGMSALSASVIGGPLTMSFIALELTGNLWLTTAVLVAVIISTQITRELFGYSFATWRLHLRGETIRSAADVGWIRDLTVRSLMRRDVATVSANMAIEEFRDKFPLGSKTQVVAVDGTGRYVGLALVADAHAPDIKAPDGLIGLLHYRDVVLHPGMNIQEAIAVFDAAEAELLAVVDIDGEHRPIGLLTEAHAMRRYAEESEQRRREVIGDI